MFAPRTKRSVGTKDAASFAEEPDDNASEEATFMLNPTKLLATAVKAEADALRLGKAVASKEASENATLSQRFTEAQEKLGLDVSAFAETLAKTELLADIESSPEKGWVVVAPVGLKGTLPKMAVKMHIGLDDEENGDISNTLLGVSSEDYVTGSHLTPMSVVRTAAEIGPDQIATLVVKGPRISPLARTNAKATMRSAMNGNIPHTYAKEYPLVTLHVENTAAKAGEEGLSTASAAAQVKHMASFRTGEAPDFGGGHVLFVDNPLFVE